jgi:hypothetical protein
LISEQPCTDNFIPITSQCSPNSIYCAELEESNYVWILTDSKIEDDGNDDEEKDDDYVAERGDSEDSLQEDINDELDEYDGDEIVDCVVSRKNQYNPFIGLKKNPSD